MRLDSPAARAGRGQRKDQMAIMSCKPCDALLLITFTHIIQAVEETCHCSPSVPCTVR
ncbi:uncharacterized protein TrAFT101_007208 [Trichoderma asperellum]|uniref:uncharacterized protein n=1 Tax=Trichoderma asperellum TaxID=101201 RepID=UPI00332EDCDD|nr:hypothetical protein TrAFT101_007208 [Trichoderma asperellum]